MTAPLRPTVLCWLLATAAMLAAGSAPAAAYTRHVIEARLQPADGRLIVHDQISVQDRTEFRFARASWMALVEVSVDGERAAATACAHWWCIALPDAGPHRVSVILHGRSERIGPGESEALFTEEGVYLPPASGWLPLSDEPWLEYQLTIEVSLPWRALTSGRLDLETIDAGRYRARFVADYPAAAPALFAGRWRVQEKRSGGVRLRTYFHPDVAPLADGYLDAAAGYLAHYSASLGDYPYADFHIVSSPLPVGLGFTNLTYIGRKVLPLPFLRERSLAHEVLHNWWGNGVAVDYTGGNWAEGLTTYLADHALAARRDPGAAREMRLAWLRDFTALPAQRDYPLTRFTAKGHDASQVIGYNKSAFVFHMLAQTLGPEAFERGLRHLWQTRRFRLTGWTHVRAAFEQAAGRDLGWFFTQWLSRSGAPALALADLRSSSAPDGHRLHLTLVQPEPAWRLDVPVSVETAAGTRHHVLRIRNRVSTHTLLSDERPRRVRVDPGYDVFRRLAPGEAPPILRDVTLDSNAQVLVADEDPAYRLAARRLAARLLDTAEPPALATVQASGDSTGPVLVIGTRERIAGSLASLGVAAQDFAVAGTARAGAVVLRRDNGKVAALVFAPDVPALQVLLRRLPHYGGKSYVLIDDAGRAQAGVAAAGQSPLVRSLTSE